MCSRREEGRDKNNESGVSSAKRSELARERREGTPLIGLRVSPVRESEFPIGLQSLRSYKYKIANTYSLTNT